MNAASTYIIALIVGALTGIIAAFIRAAAAAGR